MNYIYFYAIFSSLYLVGEDEGELGDLWEYLVVFMWRMGEYSDGIQMEGWIIGNIKELKKTN